MSLEEGEEAETAYFLGICETSITEKDYYEL